MLEEKVSWSKVKITFFIETYMKGLTHAVGVLDTKQT